MKQKKVEVNTSFDSKEFILLEKDDRLINLGYCNQKTKL